MMKVLDAVRFYWLLLRCELKCCSGNFHLEVEERDGRGKGALAEGVDADIWRKFKD